MCDYNPGDYVSLRSGKTGTILSIVDQRAPTFYEIALDDGQIIRLDSLHITGRVNSPNQKHQNQQRLLGLLPRGRLLYHGFEDNTSTDFFFLSNENDWKGIVEGEPEVHTVVSFSNNVGWDLAVQCKAQRLVLVDYQLMPLLVQQLIFRPLLLVCDSPIQFLCAVYGEAIDMDEMSPLSLLRDRLPRYGGLCGDDSTYLKFQTSILEMVAHAGLPTEWLAAYYNAIRRGRCSGNYGAYPFLLNMRRVGNQGELTSDKRDLGYEFCHDLLARYANPLPSCMSSLLNYKALQTVFKNGLYFAKGNLQEASLWRCLPTCISVMSLSISTRSHRVAFNTSNVIDYIIYLAKNMRYRAVSALAYEVLVDLSSYGSGRQVASQESVIFKLFMKKIFEAMEKDNFSANNIFIYYTTGGMESSVHNFFRRDSDGSKKQF